MVADAVNGNDGDAFRGFFFLVQKDAGFRKATPRAGCRAWLPLSFRESLAECSDGSDRCQNKNRANPTPGQRVARGSDGAPGVEVQPGTSSGPI